MCFIMLMKIFVLKFHLVSQCSISNYSSRVYIYKIPYQKSSFCDIHPGIDGQQPQWLRSRSGALQWWWRLRRPRPTQHDEAGETKKKKNNTRIPLLRDVVAVTREIKWRRPGSAVFGGIECKERERATNVDVGKLTGWLHSILVNLTGSDWCSSTKMGEGGYNDDNDDDTDRNAAGFQSFNFISDTVGFAFLNTATQPHTNKKKTQSPDPPIRKCFAPLERVWLYLCAVMWINYAHA